MIQQYNFPNFFKQSGLCIKIMGESYAFFKTHKLWKGIFRHKWILFLTILLSVLFTFALFSELYDYIFLVSESLDSVPENAEQNASNSGQNNKDTAVFGGSKFLLLILLEIVIFHFSVKTLEILNKEEYKTTFRMFLNAEIRMIKILIRGFIYSLIAQVLLYIVLSFSNFEIIMPILMFLVHSYFIGYSFFDNYNEQQKLNIKESDILIRHHCGASTTLGIVASIGLLIPIIGVLVVPVLAAITANIYGFRYNIHKPQGSTINPNVILTKDPS
jgi:CysZ protein